MDPTIEMRAWLESRAEEMAGLLEELIAVDTENPPGRGLGSVRRCAPNALRRLDLSAELIELAASGELEDPCIVRGIAGDGRGRSTSMGISTSSRRSDPINSVPSGVTARSSVAGRRT